MSRCMSVQDLQAGLIHDRHIPLSKEFVSRKPQVLPGVPCIHNVFTYSYFVRSITYHVTSTVDRRCFVGDADFDEFAARQPFHFFLFLFTLLFFCAACCTWYLNTSLQATAASHQYMCVVPVAYTARLQIGVALLRARALLEMLQSRTSPRLGRPHEKLRTHMNLAAGGEIIVRHAAHSTFIRISPQAKIILGAFFLA